MPSGKFGRDLLTEGKDQLTSMYPAISQIENEKVIGVIKDNKGYQITTNKNTYFSKIVIIALNYAKPFSIKGLEPFVIPHKKTNLTKDRIQLINKDHLIQKWIILLWYYCGLEKSVCYCLLEVAQVLLPIF